MTCPLPYPSSYYTSLIKKSLGKRIRTTVPSMKVTEDCPFNVFGAVRILAREMGGELVRMTDAEISKYTITTGLQTYTSNAWLYLGTKKNDWSPFWQKFYPLVGRDNPTGWIKQCPTRSNNPVKGYKVFDMYNRQLSCRGYCFEVGKESIHNGEIKLCSRGFHFCKNPTELFKSGFDYKPNHKNVAVCKVEARGKVLSDSNKSVTDILYIKQMLSLKEIQEICEV